MYDKSVIAKLSLPRRHSNLALFSRIKNAISTASGEIGQHANIFCAVEKGAISRWDCATVGCL
jgi:hypothetical protein